MFQKLIKIDSALTCKIRSVKLTDKFNILTKLISHVGSFIFCGILIIAIYFVPVENSKIMAFLGLSSSILCTVIVFFIKRVFKRKRNNYDNFYIKKIDPYSFPSGHISRLSCLIFPFYFILPVSILLLIFCFIISFIRIKRGYHYLSDCIAGFLIGVTIGILTICYLTDFISNNISLLSFSGT